MVYTGGTTVGRARDYLCSQPLNVVGKKFLTIKRIDVGMYFIVYSGDEVRHHCYAIVLLEFSGMNYATDAV